ncbi:MAG: GIY-YIG nuclease family protein [Candidatus Thiodiazotropha sp.]
MTCEVKNVVYVMKCQGCNEEYIGETGNYLRRRVTVHNQQIRDPKTRMLYVSEHLSICAHQKNSKFYMFPFYKMYSESTSLRRTKENNFIKLLKPKLNRVT